MTFLNPYFLAGLAAVGVPILVHLLTRDRVRRVAFSTLRFFAMASRRVLQRKRLREAILLAMRAGVCALLAVAFARPLLRDHESAGAGPDAAGVARVVLVDLSASMARPGMPEALRRQAQRAIESLDQGDLASLIAFADAPSVEAPLTRRTEELREKIASLVPGQGGTDLVEAIRHADAALRAARARRKEIFLISDLQRAGWRNFKADWRLSADVRLTVCQVSPTGPAPNLAIVEAECPGSATLDGLPRTVAVRLANFSDQERRDVPVTLAVGGKTVASQKVNLRAGAAAAVRFRHVFAAPGDNPGTVAVGADDAVADDNVWYFNVRVIPRVRVALVSGPAERAAVPVPDAGAGQMPDPAFFIEKALAPAPESPFVVRRVAAAEASAADFADVQVAILADVTDVPPAAAKALADLLSRGGGVLFCPGPQCDAQSFARAFADVAPCRLKSIVRPPGQSADAPGTVLAKVDFEHPIFEVFEHPHYGDLSSPRFRQFWEVTDSQLSRILARFDDGKPAVLERAIGSGVSMMIATPLDLRWGNFPLRAVFLPLLHQTVRYLAVRTEKRTAYQVGEIIAAEGARVIDPAGRAVEAAPAVATIPGFYTVEVEGGQTARIAVNRDPAEADPASISPEEIVAAIEQPEAAIAGARDAAGQTPDGPQADDHGLWWYVVLAVLVLTVAELVVANHTLRH